jgi:toxin-antitoxin system PIN domain toxin
MRKIRLLDVNVLIALVWPAHAQHSAALAWFDREGRHGWATCSWTQAAFIRLLSNPALSRDAVTGREAALVLRKNVAHPQHHFWNDPRPPVQVLSDPGVRIVGHQQVTDALLLALAVHNQGLLATFDHSLAAVWADQANVADLLEIISA